MRSLGRPFDLLWAGESISLFGTATTTVALPLIAVVELGAGPGWTAAITAFAWLPWLVLGLPAGALVDRRPARSTMVAADLVAAGAVLTVPFAWAFGVLSPVLLVAVAGVNGAATVFFRAAYPRFMTRVVERDDLEVANGRMFGSDSASQVVGPGLGGVLVQAIGGAQVLLLDTFSYLASAWCLWRIDVDEPPVERSGRRPLRTEIGDGVRFVRRDPYLLTFLVIGSLSNFGLTGYAALQVVFLVDEVGLGPGSVGLVVGLGAVGGLLGAVTAARISQRLGSGLASTVLLAASGPVALLVPLGSVAGPAAVVGGLFGVGWMVVAGNVIRGAWRQRYVPAELMGRVTTTSQVINFGSMPLAAAVAGVAATAWGVTPTIVVMLSIHALAAASLALTPIGRLRILPESPIRSEMH